MRKTAFILACCVSLQAFADTVQAPTPEEVKALGTKVADWQIETFEYSAFYRARSGNKAPKNKTEKTAAGKHGDLKWHMGALYAGMDQFRKIADEPAKYTDWLKMIGERNDWKLGKRPYHADDHTVGQFYLSLYQETSDPAMLTPTKEHFDWILANRKTGSLEWKSGPDCHNRWGWCDALFMAPPVWARLAKITGDRKYLNFMDEEYHATYDLLWDTEDHLFWRDSSFFPKREKNGRKLYWARGNGWVFGGLALMIPDLPEDWEGRSFYIDLYKEMAVSLKNCQREDGTWSMGLLGGVEGYPIKETSGTSFFTFGLAWGINNGLLDRATYEPVVLRGWNALTECVTDEGLLGHVQPVGASPGDSYADKTEVYGVGAFLAASTEVYKLVGAKESAGGKKQAAKKKSEVTTFMKDGGWCWFQDPRAIIHQGKLYIGSVKGNGSGPALVGIYDLESGKMLGNTVVKDEFNADDHNSPVFYVRPDGRVLTVYARHGRERWHYARITDPADPTRWGNEVTHEYTPDMPKDKVSYMNLYEMKKEGLLYNFFRGINFNPTFVTSPDYGETWSKPTHLFKNEVEGRHRPYPRYVGNGVDTVCVSVTDAHPRNFGNSIYYFEFRDGKFFRADGSLIKSLADGPIRPSESELIYQGSGNGNDSKKKTGGESVAGSAWTSSIVLDSNGHPHIGYTLYLTDEDHRYRIASWDGSKWVDREVAFGGKCLYPKESSYTGLITLDPVNPNHVYISTDVDPSTGKDSGGKHEIYAANIGLSDNLNSIEWKPVTAGSSVRNIRPVVVAGEGYNVLLWLRGEYATYRNYDLDVVGRIIEKKGK